MKSETEENFWKAWAEPIPVPYPIFFRLYYNDAGAPLYYSMEDLPGNYIEINAEEFARSSHKVRVIDNKLVHIVPKTISNKLVPSEIGTPCLTQDITIIVDNTYPNIKWSLKSNESD